MPERRVCQERSGLFFSSCQLDTILLINLKASHIPLLLGFFLFFLLIIVRHVVKAGISADLLIVRVQASLPPLAAMLSSSVLGCC